MVSAGGQSLCVKCCLMDSKERVSIYQGKPLLSTSQRGWRSTSLDSERIHNAQMYVLTDVLETMAVSNAEVREYKQAYYHEQGQRKVDARAVDSLFIPRHVDTERILDRMSLL